MGLVGQAGGVGLVGSPREATNRVQNSMAGPWEPPYQKKLYRPERGAHDTGWQKGWGGGAP